MKSDNKVCAHCSYAMSLFLYFPLSPTERGLGNKVIDSRNESLLSSNRAFTNSDKSLLYRGDRITMVQRARLKWNEASLAIRMEVSNMRTDSSLSDLTGYIY